MSGEFDVPIEGGVLRPLQNTPPRELEIWRNKALRESLARGLAQSAAGEVHDLGSFDDDEAARQEGRIEVARAVLAWSMVAEIAEPPLDWAWFGEIMRRYLPEFEHAPDDEAAR